MNLFGKTFRSTLARVFPERTLFLRSDGETRFIRLTPFVQAAGISGCALVLCWTIVSSAMVVMHGFGSGTLYEQALRDQAVYESRLNKLATERNARAREAADAYVRLADALEEISTIQSQLLRSEDRRRELETGVDVMAGTLRKSMKERDDARSQSAALLAKLNENAKGLAVETTEEELAATLGFLTAALTGVAQERDDLQETADAAKDRLDEIAYEKRLEVERNERVFRQIEDAIETSLAPIKDMFAAVGLPTDSIIEQVRRRYSGQGGLLSPVVFSTSGETEEDPQLLRANEVLEQLREAELFRVAMQG
ncbi:MAG: M23 family peptidase, partial [Boseongicola sp. SB0673_bin_14]|nr:M23 family peptidase [Boseongicola sp. SB0673_bin_14]